MIVEEVKLCEYKDTLTNLFKDDKLLLDEYHISCGTGLQNCVKRTLKDIYRFPKYRMYKIVNNKETIAFFGKEVFDDMVFMTGFCIKMEYRKKEFIKTFWKLVEKTFNCKNAYSSIYKKNTRAEEFLKKKGIFVLEQTKY